MLDWKKIAMTVNIMSATRYDEIMIKEKAAKT